MLTIRLTTELEDKLEYLSKKTHRPKSFYVKEALQRYLEDMEDVFESLERITQKDRKFYTSEEIIRKVNKDDI